MSIKNVKASLIFLMRKNPEALSYIKLLAYAALQTTIAYNATQRMKVSRPGSLATWTKGGRAWNKICRRSMWRAHIRTKDHKKQANPGNKHPGNILSRASDTCNLFRERFLFNTYEFFGFIYTHCNIERPSQYTLKQVLTLSSFNFIFALSY